MILIKFGHYVNEMMAVVKNFQNFLWSRFLIIRQNVNMATNAILNSGLTPFSDQHRCLTFGDRGCCQLTDGPKAPGPGRCECI